MRATAIFCLCLALSFPVMASADHKLKFAKPVKLVSASQNPCDYNCVPRVAWNGSKLAIVYNSPLVYSGGAYQPNGVYLMFADLNGNVLHGPTKISTDKYALYPQVVWTGSAFGVLYAGGEATGEVSYYLERYNSSGSRLSKKTLVGTSTSWDSRYSHLVWMGNQFGIFYYAEPPGDWAGFMLFCKADSSGNPTQVLQRFDMFNQFTDVQWTGKNFIIFTGGVLSGFKSTVTLQILTLKSTGQVLGNKTVVANSIPVRSCVGVELLPLTKKNRFLAIYSSYYVHNGDTAPAAYIASTDYFTGEMKAKNKKIGEVKFKNGTSTAPSTWREPRAVQVGNKYYVVGQRSCGFSFAEIDSKGRVQGEPLTWDHPG